MDLPVEEPGRIVGEANIDGDVLAPYEEPTSAFPAPEVGSFDQPGDCFNCGKNVEGGNFCAGCNAYVCEECDQRQYTGRMGAHPKEDHLLDQDGEEVEEALERRDMFRKDRASRLPTGAV